MAMSAIVLGSGTTAAVEGTKLTLTQSIEVTGPPSGSAVHRLPAQPTTWASIGAANAVDANTIHVRATAPAIRKQPVITTS
jgi:hypothetical protein